MKNHFYHIKWPPLNVTILIRTCVTCVMGATQMINIPHISLVMISFLLVLCLTTKRFLKCIFLSFCHFILGTIKIYNILNNTYLGLAEYE